MFKRSVALTVLLLTLWQSAFASTVLQVLIEYPTDLIHAALHWQGVTHQHEDSGSIQIDATREGAEHVMADAGTLPLGIVSMVAPQNVGRLSQPMPIAASAFLPSPFPDRLRRPPRTLLS